MMADPTLIGPVAALIAGIVTSLHCLGMCGPLACAACTGPCGKSENTAVGAYHGARILSYTAAGAIAGLLGARVSDALLGGATRGMTWVFVVFFVAVAAGLDKRIRLPSGAGTVNLFARIRGMGPLSRGGTLGIFTPLLPCAPLYMMVAAAALSGSVAAGATVMACFTLGTIPLLFVMQNRLAWIGRKCSPLTLDYVRRGLAVASVVLLVVRSTYTQETGCPMCQ